MQILSVQIAGESCKITNLIFFVVCYSVVRLHNQHSKHLSGSQFLLPFFPACNIFFHFFRSQHTQWMRGIMERISEFLRQRKVRNGFLEKMYHWFIYMNECDYLCKSNVNPRILFYICLRV